MSNVSFSNKRTVEVVSLDSAANALANVSSGFILALLQPGRPSLSEKFPATAGVVEGELLSADCAQVLNAEPRILDCLNNASQPDQIKAAAVEAIAHGHFLVTENLHCFILGHSGPLKRCRCILAKAVKHG